MNKHTNHLTEVIRDKYGKYRYRCTECDSIFATTGWQIYNFYRKELRIPTAYRLIEPMYDNWYFKKYPSKPGKFISNEELGI